MIRNRLKKLEEKHKPANNDITYTAHFGGQRPAEEGELISKTPGNPSIEKYRLENGDTKTVWHYITGPWGRVEE